MDTSNSAIGDFTIPDMIDDSVSMLRFFPNMQTNILASGGWDCKVRLWSINYQAQPGTFGANPTVQFNSSLSYMDQLDNPILSIAWQGQTPIPFRRRPPQSNSPPDIVPSPDHGDWLETQ